MEVRPQFGNRCLTEESDVFQHNAWDNVEWDEEQERMAKEKVELNSGSQLEEEKSKPIYMYGCVIFGHLSLL